jgi:transposase
VAGAQSSEDRDATVRSLLRRHGRTYCEQAGFALRDKPSPLFQLLVLAMLLAKPISAEIATAACGELRRIGVRTARGALRTTWQQRVDALGRAHYRRYDESTSTRVEQAANVVLERWGGDLRRLAAEAEQDSAAAAGLLTAVPGIGPTGADIFLREAQRVWPWLRPYLDQRVLDGARRSGLPHSRAGLARAFDGQDAAALGAALVRLTTEGG